MHHRGKRTFLFIEPCFSSYFLLLKAKEKGYVTLVLAAHSASRFLSEEVLNASSSLFQLNIANDEAVFDLVEKIAQKFHIEGVIPGAASSVPLTAKVATYLNKPGLLPDAAFRIQKKDPLNDTLKAHGLLTPRYESVETKEGFIAALQKIKFPCVIKSAIGMEPMKVQKTNTYEEALVAFESITAKGDGNYFSNNGSKGAVFVEKYIQGKEYCVLGFLKDKDIHIVTMTEKLFSCDDGLSQKGHILYSEIDVELFTMVECYLRKVITSLELNHGPFEAQVKLSEKGPILMKIAMHLGNRYMSNLIDYATGIDYYDNTLRLLSSQPFSLHKKQNLNASIIFFENLSKLKILQNNPHVNELKVYDKKELKNSKGKHKLGYAILVHKDVEILKEQIEEIGFGRPLVKN